MSNRCSVAEAVSLFVDQIVGQIQEHQEISALVEAEKNDRAPVKGEEMDFFLQQQELAAYQPLDYVQLFSEEENTAAISDLYESESQEGATTSAGVLTLQEAEEAIVETQYGWALGTLTEKNVEERRRLAQWAELNPALCQLFHHLHALSEDVDYSRSV